MSAQTVPTTSIGMSVKNRSDRRPTPTRNRSRRRGGSFKAALGWRLDAFCLRCRGQFDIDVEHRHIRSSLHLDQHFIVIELDVFSDDLHDIVLQLRQEARRLTRIPLKCQEHLQPLFRLIRTSLRCGGDVLKKLKIPTLFLTQSSAHRLMRPAAKGD